MTGRPYPLAIIQARMGSTRLPGKSMMPIAGETLIKRVIDSVRRIKRVSGIVLATTILEEDDTLADHVKSMGVDVYRGDAEDVLDRFHSAALAHSVDDIARICADSPIIAARETDSMVEEHLAGNYDYTHLTRGLPLGTAPTVISFAALERAWEEARGAHQREHVVPYILENPRSFRTHEVKLTGDMERDYRLTIDEKADMEMMEALYLKLEESGAEATLENAISVLDANPAIAAINRGVEQKSPGK